MDGKRLEAMSMKLMDLIVLKKQDFPFRKVSMKDHIKSFRNFRNLLWLHAAAIILYV